MIQKARKWDFSTVGLTSYLIPIEHLGSTIVYPGYVWLSGGEELRLWQDGTAYPQIAEMDNF